MSQSPPPKWRLYRRAVRIGGCDYLIAPRWCTLVAYDRDHVDTVKPQIVGPRKTDRLDVDSAISAGVLSRTEELKRFGPISTGTVGRWWDWHDTKGLLTQEELDAGEIGTFGEIVL